MLPCPRCERPPVRRVVLILLPLFWIPCRGIERERIVVERQWKNEEKWANKETTKIGVFCPKNNKSPFFTFLPQIQFKVIILRRSHVSTFKGLSIYYFQRARHRGFHPTLPASINLKNHKFHFFSFIFMHLLYVLPAILLTTVFLAFNLTSLHKKTHKVARSATPNWKISKSQPSTNNLQGRFF